MKQSPLYNEVKNLIQNFLENKKISQNNCAEIVGVSPATITNLLNDNWELINTSILLKIRSHFDTSGWKAIETTNFTTIHATCLEARNNKKMIGIIGFSGAGKTFALRRYFDSNENTYLVTCSRAMSTKQFLAEILKNLGISFLASGYEMTKRIIDELNKKNAPLLLIDEASKLSPNSLMYIQDIWDGIEGNGGIVIAGVEYLLNNLKKNADKNKIGMPEVYGRINQWQMLKEPKRNEISTLCKLNGVSDPEAIKGLYRLGNFRLVRNAIHNLKSN